MLSHNAKHKQTLLWILHLALLAALMGTLFYGVDKLVTPQGTKKMGASVTEKFDGVQLYHAAVDAYAKHARSLRDKAKRDKWRAEWYGKHDSDGSLDTVAGAKQAILEMQASLGERFEFLYSPEETQAEKDQEAAVIMGIGVTLSIKGTPANGTVSANCPLQIETVDKDSPAAKAGLQPGDIVSAIDDVSTDGATVKLALAHLRGAKDSKVKVTYQRPDAQGKLQSHTVDITRAPVAYKVVTTRDLGNGITYIKLRNFDSDRCDNDMAEVLKPACQGKALIIDLRFNPGGWVYKAMNIGQQFLPEGTLYIRRGYDGDEPYEIRFVAGDDYLIRQTSRNGKPQFPLKITDRTPLIVPEGMPVVVLVNEYTASAAEVLAGILQYELQSTVVGTTTRGKGVGQTVVDLPFGWRLHITSFDFRPAGQDLDLIGIIPDIKVDQPDDSPTDKQLEVAIKTAEDLIQKRERLEKEKQDLKQKRQDDFDKSRKKKP